MVVHEQLEDFEMQEFGALARLSFKALVPDFERFTLLVDEEVPEEEGAGDEDDEDEEEETAAAPVAPSKLFPMSGKFLKMTRPFFPGEAPAPKNSTEKESKEKKKQQKKDVKHEDDDDLDIDWDAMVHAEHMTPEFKKEISHILS